MEQAVRHTPDTEDVARMIRRELAGVAALIRGEVTRLALLNADDAQRRRFKRGPFDMAEGHSRAITMRTLDLIAAVLDPKTPTPHAPAADS
jgi:hypothetical protein